MRSKKLAIAVSLAIVASAGGWLAYRATDPGPDMTRAAEVFLGTLSPEQRATANIAFDDKARLDWHFIPKAQRKGLQIKDMDPQQRKAAHALLHSGLSQLGYEKATTIMSLEAILKELEKSRTGAPIRDPERYYFTIFGTPDKKARWGYSIEGHHLSLNFVVDGDQIAATTPTFFGANPAEVKSDYAVGPKKGTRVLKPEEDLAFKLLTALTPEQRKEATIAEKVAGRSARRRRAALAGGPARWLVRGENDGRTGRDAPRAGDGLLRQRAAGRRPATIEGRRRGRH